MSIGVSIVLIAIGAVLRWGVTATLAGINIHTIGLILMAVGVLGLVISLIMWAAAASNSRTRVDHETVVRHEVRDDDDDINMAA